jgi:hypothetical protein
MTDKSWREKRLSEAVFADDSQIRLPSGGKRTVPTAHLFKPKVRTGSFEVGVKDQKKS